ncbi:nucleoside hydrolase [Oceaniovalibus sp. ACAM 378]|uniref:nucleoside hydrolase n=1 Tax=Oceaniovalibus sp. ACAM 378 TaxID=2599923 RepID=UPI0011D5B16E|nr:nucleoside hydrolase [Oceaniovalibus sp. ACAM 378]TYB90151.1 nucleoside hydrolase [Oceaniovalibus sp. ACAM 378]
MGLSQEEHLKRLMPPEGRVRVVLDTDTYNEIDDQFAVVQMLLSPERLAVEAIYAAPFRNTRAETPGIGMELSFDEIGRLLERLGVPHDGFAHRGVTEYVGFAKVAQPGAAVDDLIRRARDDSAQSPLYVIAIGAISNVASALLKAPDIAERIVVIWLGGDALDWPRAFKKNAEFNLMQDVGGAQVLFDSGVPVILIPAMGVTSHLTSSVLEIEKHVEPQGEIGAFLARRFKEYSDDHVGWTKEIWDMAAIAWLLNDAWAPSILMPTPILADDITWQSDEARHVMRYVRYIDRDAIMKDFFRRLEAFEAGTISVTHPGISGSVKT